MSNNYQSETEAIAASDGFIHDGRIGYLPLSAANYLVRSGRWEFERVSAFGYVVRRRNGGV